jgi:hypothetical protein
VIADDLGVRIVSSRRPLIEPGGETLVQLRPGLLRQRLVGGVADEDVPEAEAVLAREVSRTRSDQLLAHEGGEVQADRGRFQPLRSKMGDSAAVEGLALDRCALEHVALVQVEAVDPGREQRADRRRDGHGVQVALRNPEAVVTGQPALIDQHLQ